MIQVEVYYIWRDTDGGVCKNNYNNNIIRRRDVFSFRFAAACRAAARRKRRRFGMGPWLLGTQFNNQCITESFVLLCLTGLSLA